MPDLNPYESPKLGEYQTNARQNSTALSCGRGCAIVFLFLMSFPAAVVTGFAVRFASKAIWGDEFGREWNFGPETMGGITGLLTFPAAMYFVAWYVSRWD